MSDELTKIPGWKKVKAFGALVKEFKGMAQFSHIERVRTRNVDEMELRATRAMLGEDEATVCFEDIPIYSFTMRSAGEPDFAKALLAMVRDEE